MPSVVVGYDGSASSVRALDRASELCGSDDVLHVVMVGPSAYVEVQGRADPNEEARRLLESLTAKLSEQGINTSPRFVETHGDLADELMAVARAVDAELIVVGRSGHRRLRRFLLGSVSTSILHHAHCDVLIVH